MTILNELKPVFHPSECNIEAELFSPVLKQSTSFDCMTGYFSSGSLEELAEPIITYLKNPQAGKLRFVMGPEISSKDYEAIVLAVNTQKNLIPLVFGEFDLTQESLRTNCIKAMAYLIANGQLEIRFALKNGGGIFHVKGWCFKTKYGGVTIHGSSNSTKGGLLKNFETLILTRSWTNEENSEICKSFERTFRELWNDEHAGISSFALSEESLVHIKQIAKSYVKDRPVNEEDHRHIIKSLESAKKRELPSLKVPDWLLYNEGDFAHQGEAIRAWVDNKYNGILTIATGGGKTLTSLVGAALLSRTEPLFITIALPTKILMNQWAEDVKKFDLEPFNSLGLNAQVIRKAIKSGLRSLRLKQANCFVLLISHDRLKTDIFDEIAMKDVSNLLIADEMHNLGSIGFQKSHPKFFKYKIGLSATPIRQFDGDGTKFLLDYFGGVVFDFPLERAIGLCLVPFKYYAHTVMLTAEEEDTCGELTHKIKKLSYAADYESSHHSKKQLDHLRIKRRRLIETASKKIDTLDRIIPQNKDKVPKTIIFCTDKDPAQINDVHRLLAKRSINFHQLTQKETQNPELLRVIIEGFINGSMGVLTSKKVLDEGFNVPSVATAFMLSSSTVQKTWIQRLGRILRKSEESGKTYAELHDFIVLPSVKSEGFDKDLRGIVMSEYSRLKFFSNLSMNGLEAGGATRRMKEILELLEET